MEILLFCDLKPYRWLNNEATQTLSPVTVGRGVEPAPEDILKLIKCQCESESPCSSLRLGCNKVRKRAKIRNRYNQAPRLTQDTNGKVTT